MSDQLVLGHEIGLVAIPFYGSRYPRSIPTTLTIQLYGDFHFSRVEMADDGDVQSGLVGRGGVVVLSNNLL
jgi:hypothetical protein